MTPFFKPKRFMMIGHRRPLEVAMLDWLLGCAFNPRRGAA